MEVLGINEDYFNRVEKEWTSINSKPESKKLIYGVTIPERNFE